MLKQPLEKVAHDDVNSQVAKITQQKAEGKRCELDSRKTPWPAIYACAFVHCLTGVQMSIYFMSTWQYLSEVCILFQFPRTGTRLQ
ncbi:hypothetical protein ANCCAN_26640 [Ancylostoma caninum]|uniref:Uncharacterized protein n=1 Tax=Ancylostoma caninum TaxID=29170 RepID=A0A368F9T2_ANCCA|nr:hypothetical protein ANCCAN_26640 [Ancylostoma caninum]